MEGKFVDGSHTRLGSAQVKSVIPIDHEARQALRNNEAAFHLGRRPQTLRVWACTDTGPIRPLRVGGRLMWRVSDLRALLGCK